MCLVPTKWKEVVCLFNHKSTHKYSRIIPLLDKIVFILKPLKMWPLKSCQVTFLFFLVVQDCLFWFLFQRDVVTVFLQSMRSDRTAGRVAVSSQEGFEESVDVSGIGLHQIRWKQGPP